MGIRPTRDYEEGTLQPIVTAEHAFRLSEDLDARVENGVLVIAYPVREIDSREISEFIHEVLVITNPADRDRMHSVIYNEVERITLNNVLENSKV